jgi:hypothetical protein
VALAQNRELRAVLDGLAAEGLPALVIKGAHLAMSHYPSPELRPRSDTDLLIREQDRAAVRACLGRLGYAPLPHVTGGVAFTQCQFWRIDRAGVRHGLDVHWRVANPRAFADRLTWDGLQRGRVSLPALGGHAFAPSAPHALMLACLHRTAHHDNSDRLIWLFDIRLLASAMSSGGWEAVADLSARTGLAGVVASGLRAAERKLRACVPPEVLKRLDGTAAGAVEPDLQRFVEGRQSPLGVLFSDWRRLTGWRLRSAFLREHLFPPAEYMARKYRVDTRGALPFLYVHRLVAGCTRWLRQ